MRLQKLLAITTTLLAMLLAAAPKQPSPLNADCLDGGTYPSCQAGQVHFTGTNYPHNIDLEIDGVLDTAGFTAPRGNVDITLSFTYDAITPGNNAHTVRILAATGKNAGAELGSVTFDIIP